MPLAREKTSRQRRRAVPAKQSGPFGKTQIDENLDGKGSLRGPAAIERCAGLRLYPADGWHSYAEAQADERDIGYRRDAQHSHTKCGCFCCPPGVKGAVWTETAGPSACAGANKSVSARAGREKD